ncbi:MAG: Cna B-type domain-containing protein [Candidatus Coprovivens sp.]
MDKILNKINKATIIPIVIIMLFIIGTLLFNNNNFLFSLINKQELKEGTEEIPLDNWELSTVFYDSTVDDGKTPLTEINWNASDGSYKDGETRVITVQINYKNTNAVTNYNINELGITIPNLVSAASELWSYTITVGANDSTHSGYDWNFQSKTTSATYTFTNAVAIEKKANLEGSIQIVYSLTPKYDYDHISYSTSFKGFTDECTKKVDKTLEATLYSLASLGNSTTITSPNYPSGYPANMSVDSDYWEYTDYSGDAIKIVFSDKNKLYDSGDYLYIYNSKGTIEHWYSVESFPNKILIVNDSYVKFAMKTSVSWSSYGFSAELSTISKITTSNKISLSYVRNYYHPWEYQPYKIKKTATKITSLDGLPNGDYYWVKYVFNIDGRSQTIYPYVGAKEFNIVDTIPSDCVVVDSSLNVLSSESGTYTIKINSWTDSSTKDFIYVGYPKEKFNDTLGNLNISNHVDFYAKYLDSGEYKNVASSDVSLNLSDFEFSYSGNLYGISKKFSQNLWPSSTKKVYYESLIGQDVKLGNGGIEYSTLFPSTVYTGKPMDVKFGDDLLYISGIDGKYRKLSDDEYYFSKISFPNTIVNGNSISIENGKYNCELWIRYSNENAYTKYEEFTNGNGGEITTSDSDGSGYWEFTQNDKIVGYYFIIKAMTESLIVKDDTYNLRKSNVVINNASNIAESGYIYNFAFLQIYIDGVIQNEPDLSSYSNFMTQLEIANYDKNTYGTYLQRSEAYIGYEKYDIPYIQNSLLLFTDMSSAIQNVNDECFYTNVTLSLNDEYMKNSITGYEFKNYGYLINDKYKNVGWEIFDLLPKGMEVVSTSEEILNSFSSSLDNYYRKIYLYETYNTISNSEFKKLILNNTTINIIENWNDTNRTYIYIKIDLTEHPIWLEMGYNDSNYVKFSIKTKISYDSYLEHGSVYKNYAYAKFLNRNLYENYFTSNQYWGSNIISDNGRYDIDATDINNNSNTSEKIMYYSDSVSITSVVSTHQDLTTYVHTDQSNYSTGVVEASYGSNYEYKLRARTGANDITNLVIYSNLEEGHNNRGHWYGEFLGIDTSYAESKGYTIKTYYSENKNASTLTEDNTWKEYNDTIDKTKVKSLAFEYLDSEGNKAILPANSLTYVLIKMKAPNDENIKTISYNSSWTEWNAIDPITKLPVDFITGINSNVVKISLPNSVQYADIDINLEKVWNDNNNEKGLRPSTLKYLLIANDNETTATEIILNTSNINLEDSNKWIKTIEVPKYDDDGNEINYSIKEISPTLENNYKYVPTINGLSITNTLSKELTITKKWIDNNNNYLTRPSNVTVKILQNNKEYKDVVITGDYSTNEWFNKITVPVYDSEGNEYVYTLEEVNVDNYESSYDNTTYTFTNILTGEEKIVITKKWIDNANKYNTRPDSITVNLKQNNKNYQNLTLTGTTNTWASNEILVPKYDSNGIKYTYTIEEDTLSSYGLTEYDQANYVITNTLKQNIEISITKNWVDGNNSYNTRPTNLDITLLQNNKEYKIITLSGNTNIWSSTIEVPKYDDNQEKYEYTIKEINENIITEYSDITYGDDGLSVTNKLKKDIDLTITKKWIDYDNEYKTRSQSVIINLYQNGTLYKELELNGDSNTWSTKVDKVPAYDDNGYKYSYTIEEVANDNLKKYQKITYDQTNLTVTNELTEKPKVTLYFTVKNGYTETGEDEIKFDEEGLKNILEKHNINPDEEYLHKFVLENIETGKKYEGYLSTQGILEFTDLPYGTYRAVEAEDEHFLFVNMLNIEDIPGVTFIVEENGGFIKIEPTGENIIYGVNVVNRIRATGVNPETKSGRKFIIVGFLILIIDLFIKAIFKKYQKN